MDGPGARPHAAELASRLEDSSPSSAPASEPALGQAAEAPRKRRKRGSRGGRNRSRRKAGAGSTVDDAAEGASSDEDAGAPVSEAPAPSGDGRRRKRSRKAASSKKKAPASDEEPVGEAGDEPEDTADDGADSSQVRRSRRGRRGGRRRRKSGQAVAVDQIPGEEDDLPELPELPDDAELVESARGSGRSRKTPAKTASKKTSKKATRKTTRRSRKKSEDEDDDDDGPPSKAPAKRSSVILVNAMDEEEQRVAVVDGGLIQDFQMTVKSQSSLVNDIYRGRVVNLEPAIGAAFIDFGQGRNGFLHTSDLLTAYGDKDWSLDKLLSLRLDPEEWEEKDGERSVSAEFKDDDEPKSKAKGGRRGRKTQRRARPRLPITSLVKKGQMVVVQVTKEAIGDKGPTLTTYISIPGRYLVLMPTISRIGVSRKIDDEKERKRLKRILQGLKIPDGMGVIVRTAGVGRKKADIQRDIDYLLHAWENLKRKLNRGHGPAPLYLESDVAIRTMRDLFTEETEAVYVDNPEIYEQIVEFTKRLMPDEIARVRMHEGNRPLFHTHSIEQDFERIFSRRVELPSGGSIVFDQTEALVAIDVNSGKTRSDGFDFEEIALKTNLEAVPEIARQIRLRDLGGIIVIDFIDMMKQGNMRSVERAFRQALSTDRARSKIGRISQFGLLELTRQRLGPGMTKKLFHPCPSCRGSGRVRNVESRAQAILRRLGSALTLKGFSQVEIRAVPEVIDYLKKHSMDELRALEHRFDRKLQYSAVPDQIEDSVLRYLRADGREVRPGGRRKR